MAEETVSIVAPVVETPVVETPVTETPKVETPVTDDKTLLGKEPETKEPVINKPVPEAYTVKIEGMEIDTGLVSALTPVFKKHGLTQDAVQELATAYAPVIKTQVEANQKAAMDAWKGQIYGWKETTIKELGAEAPKEMAFASKFIDTFGTKTGDINDLRQLFEETGVGNHPALVKALIKAGKMISSDSFVDPSKLPTGGNDLDSIYDHPTSKATLKK